MLHGQDKQLLHMGHSILVIKLFKEVCINGNWSAWQQIWSTQDFNTGNIQQWNYMAQYGLQLNSDFTVNTGSGLLIADDYFGGESGMIDRSYDRFGFSQTRGVIINMVHVTVLLTG